MIPIIIKYKCDNGGKWHDHTVTSEDVKWHGAIMKVTGGNRKEMLVNKLALGKWFGWYNGMQEALALSTQPSEAKETTVVYVKRHPFKNCCVDGLDVHPLRDCCNYGQGITLSRTRPPLKSSNRHNEKNIIAPHSKGELIAASATISSGTCEKKLEPMILHHDSGAIYPDENDTLDDRCHFPQHQRLSSLRSGRKAKPKGKC